MPGSPFLQGNFAPVADELVRHDLPVRGALPPVLRGGTLLRNGSNPRFPPVEPYHWFTGDGMVHAVTLGEDTASYRNRWVRTARLVAEERAGGPLFRGFGQPLVPEAAALDTGVANTHVLCHAGRLLALEEAHLPVRLGFPDLDTLGSEDWGALRGRFTAHPKRDPRTGQLVFFSYSADGPLSPGMGWGTVEADGRLSRFEVFQAPFCSMVHDFGVSASRVVFPVLPLTGSIGRARSGAPPFAWEPERGGVLGVLDRDAGASSLRWIPIDPVFAFHVMNAFDRPDGGIAVDVIEYDRPPFFPDPDGSVPPVPPRSRLCRWHLPPPGMDAGPVRREVLDARSGEFPRIDERFAGLPYRFGVRICAADEGDGGLPDAVVRTDLDRDCSTAHRFAGGVPSEAVFVSRSFDAPQGNGHLLTIVHYPERDASELVVLDAEALERGPVAVVELPRRVPFGFHGSWLPAS